ncbi:MAG TPA: AraC family transcriptional regulator [Candidatus Pelethocola excrementipullorum]|nr:AraC family transcriptional regulator [Candidatus Pelethocola excrementipullorum]
MEQKTRNEKWNGLPAAFFDPSIWNSSASIIRNSELELVFYGREQCQPHKYWGSGTKNLYKVHYVHKGEGLIRTDTKEYHVYARQCFIFYPDQVVYYEADGQNPWEYSWVAFEGTNAEYYLKRAGGCRENIVIDHFNQKEMEEAFANLMAVKSSDPAKDMKFISLLYTILSAILITPNEPSAKHKMPYPSMHVKEALKYIQANYAKEISVGEIAGYLYLDRKYFSRIFKKHLKISPTAYITNYRLMIACELLEESSLCVNQIAGQVGYDNPFSFSRAFKKLMGLSPANYRIQATSGIPEAPVSPPKK